MPNYIKSRKNAKRMIDKSGRKVTFIKNSRGLGDDSKPWGDSDGQTESFDMICAFVDFEVNEIDGDKVKVSDQKMLANAIDNKDHKVEDFEFIKDGDTQWRIKNVKPLKPGDIIIMYEIQVRK